MRLILLVCFLRSVNKRVPTVLDISGNFKSGISRPRKSNVNGHGNLCSQFFFIFFFSYAQVLLWLKMNAIFIFLEK